MDDDDSIHVLLVTTNRSKENREKLQIEMVKLPASKREAWEHHPPRTALDS